MTDVVEVADVAVTAPKRPWLPRLTLAFTAATAVLWLAEAVLLGGTWFNALLIGLPHEVLLPPAALLLMAAAVRRAPLEAVCAGTSAVVVLFVFCSFNVPVRRAHAAGREIPLTVVTYNIQGASGGFDALRKTLEDAEADVVLLQEAEPRLAKPALLPHGAQGWHVQQAGEMAVLSRHPIRECLDVSVQVPGSNRFCLSATIDVQGTTVHVLDFHHSLLFPGENIFRHVSGIPGYMRRSQRLRQGETDALLRIGKQVEGPLIVVGDFNAPPRDADVTRILDTWSDAFSRGGFGFGHTFDSDIPIVRVDYILTTPDIGVTSCEALASTASDHLPLRARLLVPTSR